MLMFKQTIHSIMLTSTTLTGRVRPPVLAAVILTACLTFAAGTVMYGDRPSLYYRFSAWINMPDKGIGRAAKKLLRARRGAWIHARHQSIFIHGTTIQSVDRIICQAAAVIPRVTRVLGVEDGERPIHIFIVDDVAHWDDLMKASGWREDSQAVSVGKSLFLKSGTNLHNRIDLTHELVHYFIQHDLPHALPLWLEEGLAMYWGWELTADYFRTLGLHMHRQQKPPATGNLFALQELLSQLTYPTDPERNRAFYYQSEVLMKALYERLGDEGLRELLHSSANDFRNPVKFFIERMDFTQNELETLRGIVEQQTVNK